MTKNATVKITFSKLTGEEIEVDVIFEECAAIDIPESAAVVNICFSPKKQQLCLECYIVDEDEGEKEEEEWSSSCETEDSEPDCETIDIDITEFAMLALQIRPEFPEYIFESVRLHSFYDWPKTLKQTPQQLSAAGFFYTQKDDRVICFCCGGGLRAWEDQDDPWEQHALHYEECGYLQLKKDAEYIEMVKEKLQTAR